MDIFVTFLGLQGIFEFVIYGPDVSLTVNSYNMVVQTIFCWLWTEQNSVVFLIKMKLTVRSYSFQLEEKLKSRN